MERKEADLDERIELFDNLLIVANLATDARLPMRLVGGAAMQLWGRLLNEQRAMTSDLDWALTREDLPDESTARARLPQLVLALRSIGFERPEVWRPSRSGRFQFRPASGNVDVEFLCGRLPFGRPSRRDPAYAIVQLPASEDPAIFYAAQTPWIDKVQSWVPLHLSGQTRTANVRIPTLPSLALLKLKAVMDKLERLDQEPRGSRKAYENGRLQRHGDDLTTLIRWSESRGEFTELADAIREDGEAAGVATVVNRRLQAFNQRPWARLEDLKACARRLARIATSGAS